MNRFGMFVVLLAWGIHPGCPEAQKSDPLMEVPTDRPIMPADQRPDESAHHYLLTIRVQLASVEVPVGQASDSEDIWVYLDEEAIRKVGPISLGLNGVRIGRGSKGSWPDVADALKFLTGRKVNESMMLALPGRTVMLVVKADQPAQRLFFFGADRSLCGRKYPPGDNLLAISFTLDEDDPSRIIVTGVPQIRTSRYKTQFVKQQDKMIMLDRPDLFSLDDMTFQAELSRGEFLVIGPGIESDRPSSLGHCFFIRDNKGIPSETVLIIKPEAYAAPTQTQKQPAL